MLRHAGRRSKPSTSLLPEHDQQCLGLQASHSAALSTRAAKARGCTSAHSPPGPAAPSCRRRGAPERGRRSQRPAEARGRAQQAEHGGHNLPQQRSSLVWRCSAYPKPMRGTGQQRRAQRQQERRRGQQQRRDLSAQRGAFRWEPCLTMRSRRSAVEARVSAAQQLCADASSTTSDSSCAERAQTKEWHGREWALTRSLPRPWHKKPGM